MTNLQSLVLETFFTVMLGSHCPSNTSDISRKYGEIATPDTPLALSMLANIMCYKNSAYMWYSPL